MLLTDELCVKVSHLSTANVSQSHIMKAGGKYLIIGVTRSEKYSPVCTFPFVLAQHGHHYMKGVMDEFGMAWERSISGHAYYKSQFSPYVVIYYCSSWEIYHPFHGTFCYFICMEQ